MIFYLKVEPYIKGTRRISPKEHLKNDYQDRGVSHKCVARHPFGTGSWLYEIECPNETTKTEIVNNINTTWENIPLTLNEAKLFAEELTGEVWFINEDKLVPPLDICSI